MSKLEIIQKKLKELRLYKDYLLKLKFVYGLNNGSNDISKKGVKVKKLVKND